MREAEKDLGSLTWSIITPSFRASDWLKLCIASVADQNVSLEHIVQDSCSDDGTRDWLAHDPRVTAVFEKDDGMYDGINRGLRRACGEFIAYLNCDEQYLPNVLQDVTSFFSTHHEIDVLFGDAILIDRNGSILSYRRTILPSLTHLRLAPLNTLTCATFFRRRLVEAGYFFPSHLKIAGDQYWVFQLLKDGVKTAVLPKPLAIFTLTGSNLIGSRQADVERLGWLPQDETRHWWMKFGVILWHRLGKFLAGAYRRRNLSIDIYTQTTPDHRQRIWGRSVGFRWPKGQQS